MGCFFSTKKPIDFSSRKGVEKRWIICSSNPLTVEDAKQRCLASLRHFLTWSNGKTFGIKKTFG